MKICDIALINPQNKLKSKDFINYIDTASVNDGRLLKLQFLTSNYPSRAQRVVELNDILISSVRPNLKHNYIVNIKKPNLIASTGFIQIRCISNKYLPKYIYYFLSSNKRINLYSMIADSSQTTFPSFNKGIIENLNLEDISINTQQHIVDTIGSVDDLIEKYEEIIIKLHKIIDDIFQQETQILDNVKIANLDYFNILKSGINKFNDTKIYLDTSTVIGNNITDESYTISYNNRPSRANMQPKENSIWFAKLKDSPKYILVKNQKRLINNFIFSTGFMGLQSEPYLINYLYSLILSTSFNMQKDLLSNGATMQGINNEIFQEILVPNIEKNQAIIIGKEIENYVNLICQLQEIIHCMKHIKELLLEKYFG